MQPPMAWTGARSQEAKGVAGLNWLQESGLPRENGDKEEKNTGEGQQQRELLCGFCPWGCVQSVRPTGRPGA